MWKPYVESSLSWWQRTRTLLGVPLRGVGPAQVVIETWRREYNEERPKKGLGGLTPAAYAMQLTARTKTASVTAGL